MFSWKGKAASAIEWKDDGTTVWFCSFRVTTFHSLQSLISIPNVLHVAEQYVYCHLFFLKDQFIHFLLALELGFMFYEETFPLFEAMITTWFSVAFSTLNPNRFCMIGRMISRMKIILYIDMKFASHFKRICFLSGNLLWCMINRYVLDIAWMSRVKNARKFRTFSFHRIQPFPQRGLHLNKKTILGSRLLQSNFQNCNFQKVKRNPRPRKLEAD